MRFVSARGDNVSLIVVGVDFSAASVNVLQWVRRVAPEGARIRLVHVIDSRIYNTGATYLGESLVLDSLLRDLERGAEAQLEALAEEPRASGLSVEALVKVGRPADEILASAEGASLVALGTQERTALGQLLLGSVADEVARRSPIPVLVVPDRVLAAADRTDDGARTRVLVAIDLADPSADVIRAASALADRLGVPLEAIHAAHLPPAPPYVNRGTIEAVRSTLEAHRQAAIDAVRDTVRKVLGRDVKAAVAIGSPAQEIVRSSRPGDVVVCGTHGRGVMGRCVFGSVAARLLRELPCPVLVVRPSGIETPDREPTSASREVVARTS